MSQTLSGVPKPGVGRITLALLAVVPAAMAYPWQSTRAYWLIGIAVAVLILLLGCWRGLFFTTILRRRLAIVGRGGRPAPDPDADTAARPWCGSGRRPRNPTCCPCR